MHVHFRSHKPRQWFSLLQTFHAAYTATLVFGRNDKICAGGGSIEAHESWKRGERGPSSARAIRRPIDKLVGRVMHWHKTTLDKADGLLLLPVEAIEAIYASPFSDNRMAGGGERLESDANGE